VPRRERDVILDSTYIAEVNAKIKLVEANWSSHYSFEFEGFNEPPLMDVVEMLDSTSESGEIPMHLRERILRTMINGKKIVVKYRDKELGAFILNAPQPMPGQPLPKPTPFESFPVLAENPAAFRQLLNLVIATVMEKSLPPQTVTPPAAARRLPDPQSRK
jgi:hypothetical protein